MSDHTVDIDEHVERSTSEHEAFGDDVVISDVVEQKKLALEKLCKVLGLDYKKKLTEFGSKIDAERLDLILSVLGVTRKNNYSELKTVSGDIIMEWEQSKTPVKRMFKCSWAFYIHDSKSVDEVTEPDILSSASLNGIKKELQSLQKGRGGKEKKKYCALQTKMKAILQETHLTTEEVGFDVKVKVDTDNYKIEKRKLKQLIKKVKQEVDERRELVLRVEMVSQAMAKHWDLQSIDGLVENAREAAKNLVSYYQLVQYDGHSIEEVLTNLKEKAVKEHDAFKETNLTKEGLRSGRQYK